MGRAPKTLSAARRYATWTIAEETAAAHGQTVRREDWRLSVGCHLAETREQAFEDIRVGAGRVVTEYTGGTNGNPIPPVPANEVVDYMVEHNQWIVGTPDDCMAGIARLQEASGGFGGRFCRKVAFLRPNMKIGCC